MKDKHEQRGTPLPLPSTRPSARALALLLILSSFAGPRGSALADNSWTLIGWNNLGMHCMDADYAVFALLPPYNTIHAQLVTPTGELVRNAEGFTVTYEAVADPTGSINRTSAGKTNFWEHVEALFGVALPTDIGLTGLAMPGLANAPQPMAFDAAAAWFTAEGIPIAPYDDAGKKNTYPLMRLVARDQSGAVLATTDIVLPVSDEQDCRTCHASGASPGAEPYEGWVNDPDPQRDMRLNILRLHDERELGQEVFQQSLSAAGYNPAGLFATATADGHPVLCARCHPSAALPGLGVDGVTPLTQAIHRRMAYAIDPRNGLPLESVDNRSACYACHPGSVTRCLRGAMGSAVAADGSLAMQCQSCHGSMLDVAASDRVGWLDEPACQNCHTGTAIRNNGQIRYSSAFEPSGARRVAIDETFATNPDTPAAGLSLFRFSTGHGGLACEACHGATHAEYPSSHTNDNLQSIALQRHIGDLVECDACHQVVPNTLTGGPHGMHPVGQAWVDRHSDYAEEGGAVACRSCHGADYRGTVLSRAHADRVLDTDFGRKQLWRGFQVGCFACHQGPGGEQGNPNRPAVVANASLSTESGVPLVVALVAHDPDGDPLALRIVSQPAHGTVALDAATATYYPEAGFVGADSFTAAAWDGSIDSNLGIVSIAVSPGPTPTPPPTSCPGDCNLSHDVAVDELVTAVNIALGRAMLGTCPAADRNDDHRLTADELVAAVDASLLGCAIP